VNRRHLLTVGAGSALLAVAACVTRRVPDPGPPVISFPETARNARDSAGRATRPGAEVPPRLPPDTAPDRARDGDYDVRVALDPATPVAVIGSTGAWRLFDWDGSVLVRGRAGEAWTIERQGNRVRAVSRNRSATAWVTGGLVARTDGAGALVTVGARRYRGSVRAIPTDSGIAVVNVLAVEEYLRGVVPLEIGVARQASDQAAVEAQAIAARSYTWVRLAAAGRGGSRAAHYDMLAGVGDQVYGGADAERADTDRAIRATVGLTLKFGGRVVDAPYSSACGGSTAAPDEVWRTGASTYLRRVSDRIPGAADRYYCDIAPRFSWTRTFTGAELESAVRAYLHQYSSAPQGGAGRVRGISIDARTPSGRVAATSFVTERGTYTVRANDVRSVLRAPGGEILNSTYFSLQTEVGRDGTLQRVVLTGNGYGHGVGMCQWGAIGRARAGQTARAILAAYFPGTTVGPAQ